MPRNDPADPAGRVARVLHALGRGTDAGTGSNAQEPCGGCGEETAAGSVYYSDRRSTTRSDGTRAYLCSECEGKVRAARQGMPLTDHDLATIADNGLMVGVGLLGGGGF
jgi:hypothetical protein